MADERPSFLVDSIDRITGVWARNLSIYGRPFLTTAFTNPNEVEPIEFLSRRDASYLISTVIAVAIWGYLPQLSKEAPNAQHLLTIVALALSVYRIADMVVMSLRMGVFGGFVKRNQIPSDVRRIERHVLAAVLNYIEAFIWFAILYWCLASLELGQLFCAVDPAGIRQPDHLEALVLSFTTQTTIGYGTIAPKSLLPIFFCTLQVLYGILHIAIAVAALVSLRLTKPESPGNAEPPSAPAPPAPAPPPSPGTS